MDAEDFLEATGNEIEPLEAARLRAPHIAVIVAKAPLDPEVVRVLAEHMNAASTLPLAWDRDVLEQLRNKHGDS